MDRVKVIKAEEVLVISKSELIKLRYTLIRTMNTLQWVDNFTENVPASQRIKCAYRDLQEAYEMLE